MVTITFIKSFLKIVLRILLAILATTFLYVLIAFVFSAIPTNSKPENGTIPIYIKAYGVHTDIVVPVSNHIKDWKASVKYAHTNANNENLEYLAFGWGDENFYLYTPTWSDLSFITAIKAMSGTGNAIMHTRFFGNLVEGEYCKKIYVTDNQYKKLVKYLHNSFVTDSLGNYLPFDKSFNYGENDAFYKGKGSYSILKTCNTWVNSALKESDRKACTWTPVKEGVFYQYE